MATAVTLIPDFVPPTNGEGLLTLPDNVHGEIVNGVFVEMSAPGGFHGYVTARVLRLVGNFAEANDLGASFAAETAFRLRRAPEITRSPDYAFVVAARVAEVLRPGVIEGAPDLAVEVLSPSNTHAEMQRKLAEYLRFGSRQVWIVDPETRTVATHTAGGLPRFLEGDDVLDGGDLLPGFSTPVAAFFAGLPPLTPPGAAEPLPAVPPTA